MKILKAYKFRFYPTYEQVEQLSKEFGCARWVWTELAKKIPMYKLPDGMTQEKIDAISKLIFGGDDEKISE